MPSTAVALFTSDLRLHDNPVLRAALAEADEVVPLFVLDDGVRSAGFATANRSAFLADCLTDLDSGLRERGGRLVLRAGDAVEQVCRVAHETGAGQVHLAAGASRYAVRREERLRTALAGGRSTGGHCTLRVHDAVVTAVAPGAQTPAGKDHFAVFTPYFRQWERAETRDPLAAPRGVRVPEDIGSLPLPERPGGISPGLARGGESEARRRFAAWERAGLDEYADRHDDLAGDATSRMSPFFHFGCLSPVEAVRRARRRGGEGAQAYVRQLAWRDFHHQVLHARPDAATADYRTKGDRWRADEKEIAAWKEGRTGYPVVDAGMRQLAHEGWMHNRARLLTASFLAKTLYTDWRVGARHFLDLLVDGDVANNQLNWQWVAGTGTDTRPNRILNPLAQAKRFDPNGEYVRRWVPELAGVEGPAVHRPWRQAELPGDYPAPIVDLDEGAARMRAARGRDR
ncbi:cryptochrome/photolyase family protein [Wenjunlia tyrosinilytica]|uniref:Deoxyribodipyrimidine photo-lyase n=1 Tax=Wenjunlia tyrosinilytica TaxID=1544741 RepID=A0A918DVY6_9ACTN|nr:deoxyribodipyrimidine photo-lyase [Wenjunlia tyrosinilytica]GGO84648.1 deoxyribodipyrimidine photo-lyase [Wenjunlia tyrosinilytica]